MLSVNAGAFDPADISVYNNEVLWEPTSVSGQQLYYTVSSGGSFMIKHADGRTLLTFSVVIPQDFTIYQILNGSGADVGRPGTLLTENTYLQIAKRSSKGIFNAWVRSTGDDIRTLELSATNNAIVQLGPVESSFGNEYTHVNADLSACTVGEPCSMYVGNVLVFYIAEITS